jgi:hypothetical protein
MLKVTLTAVFMPVLTICRESAATPANFEHFDLPIALSLVRGDDDPAGR